jgi:hypothetical protein
MRVIICGSRGFTGTSHMNHLKKAIKLSGFDISHVIHGANYDSMDAIAERWAKNKDIPFTAFPMETRDELAALDIPERAAGPRRNKRMLIEGRAQAVIAVWNCTSPGTADMVQQAKASGVVGFLYRLGPGSHERWPNQLALF